MPNQSNLPTLEKSAPVLEEGKKTTKLAQARIATVADGIAKGWTRDTVFRYCMDTWGLSVTQASRYYYAGVRYLVPDDPEYRQSLIDKNIARLEQMIEEAMNEGDKKVANDLIKTLQQIVQPSTTKVAMGQFQPDGSNMTIEITFD